MKKIKVLFVCLGNICRSPAAEGAFTHLVESIGKRDQFQIDSSGTGDYHIGDLPHQTTRKVAREHGIDLVHRARQFHPDDFAEFDFILVMDEKNRTDVLNMARDENDRRKVYKYRQFDPEAKDSPDVPDPYFGGTEGFHHVQEIVSRTAKGFYDHIAEIHKL